MAYHNPDPKPEIEDKKKTIIVRFRNEEDMIEFGKKLNISCTKSVKSINFSQLINTHDIFD